MKPRIRWSPVLAAWILQRPSGITASMHTRWPQALAALGIPCPEGWS